MASTAKWEYLHEHQAHNSWAAQNVNSYLKGKAEDGWRLHTVIEGEGWTEYYFERELTIPKG